MKDTMKAFIAISKNYRERYKDSMPFIWAMCKRVMRDDVRDHLTKYEHYKNTQP